MMRNMLLLFSIAMMIFGCEEYNVTNNEIEFDNHTFTVLTSGLIAVRASAIKKGNYKYNFDHVVFDVKQSSDILTISTAKYQLFYQKGEGRMKDKISIEFKKRDSLIVADIHQIDAANLGGLIRSVDKFDGKIEYEEYDINSPSKLVAIPKGLLSKQGWTVLKVIDNELIHNDVEGDSEELFIFCYGDNYKKALNDFTQLNGNIPLLPKWALGNWFSRYQPLSAQGYKDIVSRFRKEQIPIDVIVPDMNWHIDGWFGTRYDSVKFPDMNNFLDWTNQNGLHVGFNHHPGAVIRDDIKAKEFLERANMDYDSLLVATEKQYQESKWEFIKNALFYGEGNSNDVEPFFDVFLKPMMDEGLDFHWVDGSPSIKNLKEYYRLTEQHSNKRAIVLTRQVAGSFDNHKYPIGFSGDSYISWESLKFNVELTVKGSNLGVYWSHDIGGHMEGHKIAANSELFARWIQSGVMSPFNRLHATGGVDWDRRLVHNRKPWDWGEKVLSSARKAMQLKYKLMPYTYSLNRKAFDEGLIMCYGMYFDYPKSPESFEYSNEQYMYGSSMLFAPITDAASDGKGMEGIALKKVWIPKGLWYDYFSGEKIQGPIEILVSKSIDEFPLFVKEGAIIPMVEYMDYTDQKPLNKLIIECYQPTKTSNNSFKLYEDDGKTLDYKNEKFRWTTIDYNFNQEGGSTIVIHPVVGDFDGAVTERNYQVIVKGITTKINKISINSSELNIEKWNLKNNILTINTDNYNSYQNIEILIE
ncbi:TIM-barrel domain-containing protein [uncultured Lutibacter sp.]|uniref:glycoside hydrolase family 31 protein n=1 Tax=uncultured Lutibacter sp. TaxID=437739 RepID=UPI00262D5D15|nr:TIM-barrel domain-containing protein [uncultured Lutibacter sp.]